MKNQIYTIIEGMVVSENNTIVTVTTVNPTIFSLVRMMPYYPTSMTISQKIPLKDLKVEYQPVWWSSMLLEDDFDPKE